MQPEGTVPVILHRLKALEAQVEELSRSHVLSLPLHLNGHTPQPLQNSSEDGSIGDARPANTVTAAKDHEHRGSVVNPDAASGPAPLILYNCVLPWSDVEDLARHFSTYNLPHCQFLGDIIEPARLATVSRLLLWTIVMVASRHHKRLHHRYEELRDAHEQLFGMTCCEAIQNPLDLQAVLLLCMWPPLVRSQWSDSSWMHLGSAISCARQMGLDKRHDEVFFGMRKAANQLSKFPRTILRLTWLKCFEIDVQLSLWHGNLPTLAATRHLEAVIEFCRDHTIPRDLANTMDIHVRTTRYLMLLDETQSAQLSWSLCKTFIADLAIMKADRSQTWSGNNEVVSNMAMLYICLTGLVKFLEGSSQTNTHTAFPAAYGKELLTHAKDRAIDLVTYMCALSSQVSTEGQGTFREHTTRLPGFPKHSSRIVFIAATVLLKYLDDESDQPAAAQEDVRNAFQMAHLFFRSCELSDEHIRAGQTLEVAGRAIGRGRAHVQNYVTTRMGASIMYNIKWLGGLLRGRDKDAEYATPSTVATSTGPSTDCEPPSNHINNAVDVYQACHEAEKWPGLEQSTTVTQPSDAAFPFGVWDNLLYDDWSNSLCGQDIGNWDPWFVWDAGGAPTLD
ncbi:uncharacterized protein LTR77_009184 [Saxophila tyrrhenica]|uniref:Xylanolytic transcriptional activator regulatory domain-containing protein n=1 Tax=Saxophila tyrrhenica TaxID=1690608 RepID=A0AAV9NYD7_9PEZI|nr:hypothetical protein LTR77_009184 [Saxophila tyrrhenica]